MVDPGVRWSPLFEALERPRASVFIDPLGLRLYLDHGNIVGARGVQIGGADEDLSTQVEERLAAGEPYEKVVRSVVNHLTDVFVAILDHEATVVLISDMPEGVPEVPMPVSVRRLFSHALAIARPAETVAAEFKRFLDCDIRVVGPVPRVVGPVELRTLRMAKTTTTLRALALLSGRGDESRTRSFWLAFDALRHRDLIRVDPSLEYDGFEELFRGLIPNHRVRMLASARGPRRQPVPDHILHREHAREMLVEWSSEASTDSVSYREETHDLDRDWPHTS